MRDKRLENDIRKYVKLGILGVCLILLLGTAGFIAKYVTEERKEAEIQAAEFYMSSNYLEEAGATHIVSDWGNKKILVELYNYQKENLELISKNEIQYKIEATAGTQIRVVDGRGLEVVSQNDVYTMEQSTTRQVYYMELTYPDGVNELDVSVTAVSPYKRTLSAKFELMGKENPTYKIEDQGNYVLVTIWSNDYSGDLSVNWNKDFSPNNADLRMAGWEDSQKPEAFRVESNSTYELIFLKNTDKEYSKTETTSRNIEIGGE